jgi:hypothetical protein
MAGAPKGNQNAKGNKGGGRKSAYQELADATDAHKIFFDVHDQEEIEAKIRTGKFSLKDRLILTGMEGDTASLQRRCTKPCLTWRSTPVKGALQSPLKYPKP